MNTRSHLARAASGVLLLAAINQLSAQSVWDGGGADNNLLTPGNWNGDTAPASGNGTILQLAGETRLAPVLGSAFQVQSLLFNSGAGAFTLSGPGLLSIHGAGSSGANDNNAGIRNNSASLQTIENGLLLTGHAMVLANTGSIALKGDIDKNGKQLQLRAYGSNTIVAEGVISGGGGIVIRGSGSNLNNFVRLSGDNTFSGNAELYNGHVRLAHDKALGQTAQLSVGLAGGNTTRNYILTEGARTISQSIRLLSHADTYTVTIGGATADVSTYSGNIHLHTAGAHDVRALTVAAVAGGRVNFDGDITREAAATGAGDTVTKTGLGVVALNGSANNYTGSTLVDEGTLLVNGSLASAIAVQSGAFFGGTGSTTESLTLNAGSTFLFDVSDVFSAASVGIGGGALLSLTGDTTGIGAGDTRTLASISGTFANLADGASLSWGGFDWQASYAGGGLTLTATAIPEPSAFALLGGGLALAGTALRRRRR